MKYFHDHFERNMVEADILNLISNASEFQHIQVSSVLVTNSLCTLIK